LIDERPRRILVSIIRSDTGPKTKRSLAEGFVIWCLGERMAARFSSCEGTAVFGQEVFRSPRRRKPGQSDPDVVVKYTLSFQIDADGRIEFTA
jgi:hypothetical protein